jgi:hypothetical protein
MPDIGISLHNPRTIPGGLPPCQGRAGKSTQEILFPALPLSGIRPDPGQETGKKALFLITVHPIIKVLHQYYGPGNVIEMDG